MEQHSSSASSCSVIDPPATLPTPSNTSMSERSFPALYPGSMFPPVTTIAGILIRAAAISMPGTILSQVPTQTRPSRQWDSVMSSIESAIFSREGSAYRIPSWPMATPSQIPMTPNSNGTPPPAAMPSRTFPARFLRWTCPGTISFHAFAIPMNGRSISRSVIPSDLRSALFGDLATPFLIV
ncbi:MAG: hypothetical protein A4E40_01079 [Methanoregulaceae archaeon PtaU1.Bin059]|nr:MAG: hypothetical protein A4E40_01079 [Methanoregulaceae archaeon PtaU1.Bin059]